MATWHSRTARSTTHPTPILAWWVIGSVLLSSVSGPWTAGAWAMPSGAEVEHGTASAAVAADGALEITASDQAVLRWQSFDIASADIVRFLQPSTTASVLNRIVGGSASQIAGTLTANGLLILINPAGLLFAPSAVVNVGGLIASSLDLADADFLARQYRFMQPEGAAPGTVVNRGALQTTADGGVIALVGGAVANTGSIAARLGTVALAAGAQTTVSFEPDGRIAVAVDAPTSALVLGPDGRVTDAAANAGTLSAPGGTVLVSASAARQVFDRAVNQTGIIEAGSVAEQEGRIVLTGLGGDVRVAGTLQAHGGITGPGGEIQVRAIGGDAVMAPETLMDVRGGTLAGAGGHGELSATGQAIVSGTVLGDAVAGFPRGTFMFDPTDLTINSNTTVTTDTTYFADRDVKIEAHVTANSGASLKFLADHNSATLQDWDNGSGKVSQKNGKVVTTTGGGSVTFAGKSFSLANNGVNASGDLNFYYNDSAIVSQQSDLVNKIAAFSGTLGLYATGELKLGDDLNSAALFNGTNALRLESDSHSGGQAADLVNFNGKNVNTRNGNLTVVSRGTNALALTALNAGTGMVNVTAGGAMTDGNGAATNVTAGTLTATAAAGLDLDTAVDTVSAGVTGSGALDLSDTDALTVTSATTANGGLTIVAGGPLTVTNAAAAGAGSDITLTANAGTLTLGTVTAADDVTLTAAGAIEELGTDSAADLVGDAATLTAAAGIGAAGTLETTLTSLAATITGPGALDLADTDALTVTGATTNDGALTIASGGTMTVGAVNGSSVALTASNGGSILSNGGGSTTVTAATGATLTAGGTIGTSAAPVTVAIGNGPLTIIASGVADGVSAHLRGTVSPSNNLNVPLATLGRVLFNAVQRYPVPSVLQEHFAVLSTTLTEFVKLLDRPSSPRRL